MAEKIRVATWNIGGAHTVNSNQVFDYDKENLPYFAENLRSLKLDVICIQESHTNKNDVLAGRLADMLGMPFVFDSPRSPSHIDENYQLSNAIISKYPIEDTQHILLPDPSFELFFQNGTKARLFHTYVQTAQIRGAMFANTHLQPLHLFGYSWGEGVGQKLASETERVFLDNLEVPLLFAGDFNTSHLQQAFPQLTTSFHLQFALDDRPTDNRGKKVDYILYSPEFTLVASDLIITSESDHYLGWAEFELSP